MVAIKGHFDGKVFVPDEPVDFPRNRQLILHIESVDTPGTDSAQVPSSESAIAEGETDALQWIIEHPLDDPALPKDLSFNLHHYLYGTPKRDVPPTP